MKRTVCCAGLALVLCAVAALAAEFKDAKLNKIDTDKKTVNITADGKEHTLKYDEKTKWSFTTPKGDSKELPPEFAGKFAEAVNKGGFPGTVTVTTDDKDYAKNIAINFAPKVKGGEKLPPPPAR